jgi:hypothetical protein
MLRSALERAITMRITRGTQTPGGTSIIRIGWKTHHPEWAKNGDWDEHHHHWYDRDWWKTHNSKWAHDHHSDWF